jgi:hypothetical protein
MSELTKPERVRIALPSDEAAILALLIEMHASLDAGWGWPYRTDLVCDRIEAGTRPDLSTRSNPMNKRLGRVGVVDGSDGIIASTGVFLEQATWYSDAFYVQELWLYVKPSVREDGIFQDLFDFNAWVHQEMTQGIEATYPFPMPLATGFLNMRGDPREVEVMERLWRRHSGAQKCGVLFMRR